ncbi:MAG: glycoside hydrolase family 2 protein [Bacteroidales bacterium]|nr:glycoside hydrolase family 2 protein [Bacteroidales bacterium]
MIRSMKRAFALVISIFCMITITLPLAAQDGASILSLDGVWQLRMQGSKKIHNAVVPGSVQLDLLRNNVIPDPFYADFEEKLQWISDTGWVYEKYFELDRDFFANRNIQLVCEGIDTYANVYINDSLVITADNMFKTWYANTKHYLRIGYNRIKIEFPSITKLNKAFYDKLPYKLPGDERMVCRKAAYQFGWDWGPRFVTMGIWRPIYIKYWKYVDVLGVNFIQKSLTDSLARMSASFIVVSTLPDTAEFKLMFDSTVFFEGRELLTKGVNSIRIDFDMTNPKRWWPNGMGAPTRYNLGYQVWFAGRKEAEGHQKVGLRTVELVQEPDSVGKSFYLKINDVPVFIRGANYIPMDNFPSRVTDSMYTELIKSVDAANINMLRVWGGGIYENDIFYDLCDEKGIMVWQDFMFANGMLPEEGPFFRSVQDEIIQNIVRLRRHPSIVLWCGNNEIEEGWYNWGWVKDYGYSKEDSSRIFRNYRKIFKELIPYALLRHDTLRPYISTSPMNGWGNEKSLKEGDLHYWGVWWGKEPFDMYNKKVGRFVSEYGFQGFPDYSTIEKVTPPTELKLGSDVMKAHQKHPVGFETIDEYMKRDYKVPEDLETYGYVSQLLQADGLKTAIEAHRRAKPYCMGTMYWQLNDSWPVVSWSTIDYYGKKKAAYYAVSRNYRDFFIVSDMEGDQLKVYATFDEPDNQDANLWVVLADFDGNVLWQEEKPYEFSASRTEVVVDTNLAAFLKSADKSRLFIYTQIKNILGVRASNLYYFVSPKDMKLEKAPIDLVAEKTSNGYSINLYTTKLAKGVYLRTPLQGDFSDNYFDLMPFEEKRIQFNTVEDVDFFQDSIKVISLVDTYLK